MTLIAKPIVKNKFWIVESSGEQIATIQSTPGGVTYVHDTQRENFPSIKILGDRYNIQFDRSRVSKPRVKNITGDVYGYPCQGSAFNEVFDVPRKLPLYTKTATSKSYFCAGHYMVSYDGETWEYEFSPKLIALNRYEFLGPFATQQQALAASNG
jgi:hypothetical protein